MRVEVKIEDPAGFDEVEVIAVEVAVGDTVADGDVLLEIATDKANMDIVAPTAGTIAELLVAEGDIIPTDNVLVVMST